MEEFDFFAQVRGTVCPLEQAEVVGWGCKNAGGPLEKIGYKHCPLRKDQLIIQLLFTGLCQSDYFKLSALWSKPEYSPWPMIPGHQIIGKVVKIGDEVKLHKIGDIVGAQPIRDHCGNCLNCKKGMDNNCNGDIDRFTYDPHFGGYATQVKIPEQWTFKIPDGMPLEKIPPLLCAGLTCFAPLRRYSKAGMSCAVVGIGGLGHLGVMYAVKMGLKVTAVSMSDSKKKLAIQELGAFGYINLGDPKEKQTFENTKYDIVLNTGLLHDISGLLTAVRSGGILIQVGLPDASKKMEFPHNNLVGGSKSIIGSLVGSREETEAMLEFSAVNKIYPMVQIYSFEDFPKAYHRMTEEKPNFRVVVDVKSFTEKQKA